MKLRFIYFLLLALFSFTVHSHYASLQPGKNVSEFSVEKKYTDNLTIVAGFDTRAEAMASPILIENEEDDNSDERKKTSADNSFNNTGFFSMQGYARLCYRTECTCKEPTGNSYPLTYLFNRSIRV